MKEEKDQNEETQEETLESLVEKNKELEDKYVRLYAEFENHKRRFRSQISDIKIQTKHSTVKELLDIVDDITLSKNNLGKGDPESWINGSMIIFDKIDTYIKTVGIEEEVCEMGTTFDPEKHDCVTVIDMGEDKKGTIVDVIKRGYKIDGKMIKYPKVVVGK